MADRSGVGTDVRAACGHARYAKGCELCALVGIYHAHLGRPGITPSERSKVMRLYLAGDKAGLFKLWQARRGGPVGADPGRVLGTRRAWVLRLT